MSEHTQLPWMIDDGEALKIRDGDGNTIGMLSQTHLHGRRKPGEALANARYIVLAANNHHKLVEALKTIAGGTEDTDFPFRSLPEFRMREIARDALAAFKEAGQ